MLISSELDNSFLYFLEEPFNSSEVISVTSKRNILKEDLLKILNIEEKNLIFPKQVHSIGVVYVRENNDNLFVADALFTDKKQLALAVLTADCVPIFLYERKNNLVGIIHAGWRNTKDNILKATLEEIRKYFRIDLQYLYLGFGPAIRLCCYEVKEDVAKFFDKYVVFKDKKIYLDLVEVNKNYALELGIERKNIFDSKICTSCNHRNFYSFRKGDKKERIISLIMLK